MGAAPALHERDGEGKSARRGIFGEGVHLSNGDGNRRESSFGGGVNLPGPH